MSQRSSNQPVNAVGGLTQKLSNKQNITVGVRIRPLNQIEREQGSKACLLVDSNISCIKQVNTDGKVETETAFEHVFNENETNKTIFDKLVPKLIDESVMAGFNSVLFMYGQTSSGKTYTLFGSDGSPGLVEYAMDHVHKRILASTDTEYVIRFSYAELYIDNIKDLFGTSEKNNFPVVKHAQMGSMIQGLTEFGFQSAKQVVQQIKQAEPRRTFTATKMNPVSSRSHAIIRLTIESRTVSAGKCTPLRDSWGPGEKFTKVACLSLVDLAGSENTAKSDTQGSGRSEGNNINKSLLALTNVITDLSNGKSYINYRDHNLTMVLESALGGNAKTILLTCLSPAQTNISESRSAIKFASKAKCIKNRAKQNFLKGDAASLEAELEWKTTEIERLEALLSAGLDSDEKKVAIQASKDLLSLRCVLHTAPRMVKSLKNLQSDIISTGQLAILLKKLRLDIQDAMVGTRNLGDIVAEHHGYIAQYLSEESELLRETEMVLEMLRDGQMIERCGHLFENGEGSSTVFDFGECDELQVKLKVVTDELTTTQTCVVDMEKQCTQLRSVEKTIHKEIDELKVSFKELQETVQGKTQNEARLCGIIDELRQSSQKDKDTHNEHTARLTERINELTVQMDEQKEQIQRQMRETMSKDDLIEQLRTHCEAKDKELVSAAASHLAYETDSTKARAEMRAQMERLQGNMRDILRQGGEESKVIESHNELLQRELEKTKDVARLLILAQDRGDVEASHLRTEIAVLRDQLKSREDQITVSVEEVSDLSQKLRDIRAEMIRTAAALTTTEQHNEQLVNEVQQVRQVLSQFQMESHQRATILHKEMIEIKQESELRVGSLELALRLSQEQTAAKQVLVDRLERTVAIESERFHEVTSQQAKSIGLLEVDKAATAAFLQSEQEQHLTEMREVMREKMALANRLDLIDQFLQREEENIAAREQQKEEQSGELNISECGVATSVLTASSSSPGVDRKSPLRSASSRYNNVTYFARKANLDEFTDSALESSDVFRSLLKDMMLMTRTLETTCKQNKGLYIFMISHHQAGLYALDIKQAALMDCTNREKHLTTRLSISEDSLQYARSSETKLKETRTTLEESLLVAKKQFRVAQHDNMTIKSDAETERQCSLNLKAHFEKLQSDARIVEGDLKEEKRRHDVTNTQMSNALLEGDRVRLELGRLQQQLSVTESERDDLMRLRHIAMQQSRVAQSSTMQRAVIVTPRNNTASTSSVSHVIVDDVKVSRVERVASTSLLSPNKLTVSARLTTHPEKTTITVNPMPMNNTVPTSRFLAYAMSTSAKTVVENSK